jgi:hypothetical protein
MTESADLLTLKAFQSMKTAPKSNSAATQRWEQGLGGLSAKIHRINKNYTVYRSRAKGKLQQSQGWSELSSDEQKARLDEEMAKVNEERDRKVEEAKEEWKVMHNDDADGDDGDDGHDSNESDDSDNSDEWEDVDDSEVPEAMKVDDEAEEGEDGEEGIELSENALVSLGENLRRIRHQQVQESQRLIEEWEEHGNAIKGDETPDDFEFGA